MPLPPVGGVFKYLQKIGALPFAVMDVSGRHGPSAEGFWSPQLDRACKEPSKSRSASIAAAAKILARARARRGASKVEDNTALM